MSFLLFFLVLGVIVAIHEFGHFLFAKIFGIKVLKFSIGFNPTILSKKIGETEYAIGAVPLGGYVKMEGEFSGQKSSDPRSYDLKPRWQRIVILLAGPAFNFISGFLIVLASFSIFGTPAYSNRVVHIQENTPVAISGIKLRDKIISVNGKKTATSQEVINNITSGITEKEIELEIERDAERIKVKMRPTLTKGGYRIGVGFGETVMIKSSDDKLSESVNYSAHKIKTIFLVFRGIFSGQIEAKDSIGGPIAISGVINKSRLDLGLAGILLITAIISFNLGIVNLLPIPVLDGGGIAILVVEMVMGKSLNKKIKERILYMGLAILLTLMLFTTFLDISRLF